MPHLDLRDGKKVSYTPNPTDRDGNATSIQAGSLVLVSSNEEVVAVSSDGNTGVISSTPGGGTGFVAVTATADADLGEGVRTITESWSVSIIPGDAAALGGTIGPEEDSVDEQPAETPTPVTE